MRTFLILAFLAHATASALAAGQLTKHQFSDSQIYPGTTRDYWIYVPAEYDSAKPAALMIFQDGAGFVKKSGQEGYVPDAFDRLIASGEMPVTIGLFINPGIVPTQQENGQARPNRSYEYDSLGPNYANFLIQEMLPLLKDYHISTDPDDRALCGVSSGAIASFTAAWERPDHFRRVYSMIGSYVDLRGGHAYPTLIRKTEPKPLRIFLQDGKNDLNNYGGDWWMANQSMQRALAFSGYEHTHRWDEGGHSRKEGNKLLIEALTWLWKDHGKTPVSTHLDHCKSRAGEWLIPDENWQVISVGHSWAEGLAVTNDGTLYFTDVHDSELYKITPDGEETLFAKDTARANGIALGPDGKTLYTCGTDVRKYDLETGQFETLVEKAFGNDIVVSHSNNIYYTSPKNKHISHLTETPKFKIVDGIRVLSSSSKPIHKTYPFKGSNGIGLSADQTQLLVCQASGPFVHTYSLNTGEPSNPQPFFYTQGPSNGGIYALDGQFSTSSGHLLVGTNAGLQILDHFGRLQLILPRPAHEDERINYCYLHQNTLYIATRYRIYKRKIKLTGAPAWQAPVKIPKR